MKSSTSTHAVNTNHANQDTLWTREQVAAFLQVSQRTVWTLTASGSIPHIKIGPRIIRYNPEAVQQWALEQGARR